MNNDLDQDPTREEQFSVGFLTQRYLERIPSRLADLLMAGALPHWLDEGVISVLFPDYGDPKSVFLDLESTRVVTQAAPGQLIYQSQVRDYLLSTWYLNRREQFHQLSASLAAYHYSRSFQPGSAAKVLLPEYVYHLLAVNPLAGIRQLCRLFERAIEAHEFGLAERLAVMAEERQQLLGEHKDWLGYFPSRLALARYDVESAVPILSTLATTTSDPNLSAYARRALGMAFSQSERWSEAISEVRQALVSFDNLHLQDEVAWTKLLLGDVYRNFAKGSGGIYEERREFANWLHFSLHVVADFPFIIYQRIADRVDVVPKLYGANYQNWIVLRLLRSAAACYHDAEGTAKAFAEELLQVDVQQRLADIELDLGIHRSAERRYRSLLATPQVRSSEHRCARIGLGVARLELLRNERSKARTQLRKCLDTFCAMGDWCLAGEAGFMLGCLSEVEHELSDAVKHYATAIRHASRANDLVRRTEIVTALEQLVESSGFSSLDEHTRHAALSALDQVDRRIFVARFPGEIQRWFAVIFSVLSGPILFATALILAILFGVTFLLVEGNVRDIVSDSPVPLGAIDWAIVILTALVPFYALWLRDLFYVLIGAFVVRFLLPIAKIERSRPQFYVLDAAKITRHDGLEDPKQTVLWEEVNTVVVADRCIWRNPIPLSSKTVVISRSQRLVARGTTHNYQDLKLAIEAYWQRYDPKSLPVVRHSFSIFRHWWLGIALALAGVLAAALVLRVGIYQEFCATPYVNGTCPDPIKLVVASWAMWTSIFFVLFFAAGTLVRSIIAAWSVRKAIEKANSAVQLG